MSDSNIPLPERLRPRDLSEIIGQDHLLGSDAPLRQMIDQGHLPSIIFWGPPGVGKTTIALLLAQAIDRPFVSLSALNTGVKELREVISDSGDLMPPVVFIDEIHRFNKTQQDALLNAVEKGKITLIGATTENPSFEVNSALLSRCQVYTLNALNENAIQTLINHAIEKDQFLKDRYIQIEEFDALVQFAAGDARKALNLLDLIASTFEPDLENIITNAVVVKVAQQNIARYDKAGEQHYDLVSAFIKSIRGSDPDGALYWMARMLKGGEDPVFIARRMLIAASEDIGNSNPNALLLAGECFRSVQVIGMPESRIILGQCAVYLATSAKSNSTYLAINKAMDLAEKTANLPVPLHLRNAPTKLMKEQGYGVDYLYPHNYPEHFVLQEYLPPELKGTKLYESARNKREVEGEKLQQRRWQQQQ
ncbi:MULTISPECIES: replication-associated recombination protein A [Acinetobacter]|uniref:Replication-associated recombination protein A n=1 Tax=Acinetobacter faecalis TaxID=2665161 RepID=A0AB35USU6_9GAMM|nr:MULTISPECIES: replication-associated recombination protein A [Acinetobacter]MDY6460376.1 replication-associated recombination protein A [Acinetobacter faecalis]MDY6462593.1 replication-associated recombination protein A [Acinetobacter faecalis]MDY6485276.1 replication-associated recombination protein A [Acinetobacter faecalis]MDY6487053.1 replication-associated recombination protein A [Acinetobacter faecalis]MDY6490112.1 replication-associated recombination protein A [Acinetobacter faecalis